MPTYGNIFYNLLKAQIAAYDSGNARNYSTTTTDATPKELFSETVAPNTMVHYRVIVCARSPSDGAHCRYVREFTAVKNGNDLTISDPIIVPIPDLISNVSCSIELKDTSGDVELWVTGDPAKNLDWTASVHPI